MRDPIFTATTGSLSIKRFHHTEHPLQPDLGILWLMWICHLSIVYRTIRGNNKARYSGHCIE